MNLEPAPKMVSTILVHDLDEFRDVLPESGVFDIMDCKMKIEFSPNRVIENLEKYITLVESCINLTGVDVQPDSTLEDHLRITISEVPLHVAENRDAPKRVFPRTPAKPKAAEGDSSPGRIHQYMQYLENGGQDHDQDLDFDDDELDNE